MILVWDMALTLDDEVLSTQSNMLGIYGAEGRNVLHRCPRYGWRTRPEERRCFSAYVPRYLFIKATSEAN